MAIIDWVFLSILVYVCTAVGVAAYAFVLKKSSFFEPIGQYLFFVSLFTLPLPIRVCFTLDVEGDITPHLLSLLPYFPATVLSAAISLPIFAFSYYGAWARRIGVVLASPRFPARRGRPLVAFFVLASLSVVLILLLTREAGGLIPFLLLGYSSSEETVGKGYLSIGFPWLFVASTFLLLRYAQSRSKRHLIEFALIFLLVSMVQLVTGNRGMLMYMGICTAVFWNYAVRKIGWSLLIPGVVASFLALNLVGALRGSHYDSGDALVEQTSQSAENLSLRKNNSFFYTLTVGEFVVPIETLPQIMQVIGPTEIPWGGASFLRAPLYVVPSAIFPERPLPLANWYIERFYGKAQTSNEGRAFFFLTEGYLNFGPPGIVLVALFWGAFWGALHSWLSASRRDLAVLLIYSLMVGFIFRCIRGDFSTLLIATTEQSLIAAAIGLWLSGSSWVTVGKKKIRARD